MSVWAPGDNSEVVFMSSCICPLTSVCNIFFWDTGQCPQSVTSVRYPMSAFWCRILYLYVIWVSDCSALVPDGDIDTFYTILHWNRTCPQVRGPVACASCLLPLWGLTSLTVYWSFSLRDTLMQRPCKSSVAGVWCPTIFVQSLWHQYHHYRYFFTGVSL